jgi:hypothetical protein
MTLEKPAWYALESRGALADFFNLLHPPYTLWHLSYVLIGIALSPTIYLFRSIAVLVSFFLGLGIGAHALDETMGNPLKTRLSKRALYSIGFTSLVIAAGIGGYYVLTLSIFLLPLILIEVFFALSYNLESFNRRFHNGFVFSISWGALPLITGYFVNALSLSFGAILASVAVALLTFVQRTLSTQARSVRRSVGSPVRALKLENGEEIGITSNDIISPAEKSLKALTLTIFVFAVALICQRLLAF